jgi:hypothetical protein
MEIFPFGGTNTTGETALVIAGIHGSELSGIEVARWLVDMLLEQQNKLKKPYYHTLIIPEIYPESAKLARLHSKNPKDWLKDLQTTDRALWEKAQYNVKAGWEIGREVIIKVNGTFYTVYPARQFPPPGELLSFLEQNNGPTDATGKQATKADSDPSNVNSKKINAPILPEAHQLLTIIELFEPVRIVSIHGKHMPDFIHKGIDAPGIFVDPRYDYNPNICGINPVNKSREIFGTNLCKFDVIKDPAFPFVGFFEMLNVRKNNPPLSLSQQEAIKKARDKCEKYIEKRKKTKEDTEEQESQLKVTAKQLNIDYDKDYLKKKSFPSTKDKTSEGDDLLALKIAKAIASKKPELVPGNWLAQKSLPPVVHYSASSRAPDGYSLGDWGPVTSGSLGNPDYRIEAPVITVEVFKNEESGAFDSQGIKQTRFNQDRANELRIYAEALMTIFLRLGES